MYSVLKKGNFKIPSDFDIKNKICRDKIFFQINQKTSSLVIDEDFKFIKIPISTKMRDGFKYYGKNVIINLYKFLLIKILFKFTNNDDVFKLIISLTLANSRSPISTPNDIANLCLELREPPNWVFILNVMYKRPPIMFVFININDLTDVRQYKPFVGIHTTVAIFYYNHGAVSLRSIVNY